MSAAKYRLPYDEITEMAMALMDGGPATLPSQGELDIDVEDATVRIQAIMGVDVREDARDEEFIYIVADVPESCR